MAECELRQRKKEDGGNKLPENNEENNEKVLTEDKPETVRCVTTYLFISLYENYSRIYIFFDFDACFNLEKNVKLLISSF